MEPEKTSAEQPENKFDSLLKVTPLSKYLAMALFVTLPFVGGWIGYTFAPEKIVEVEKVLPIEKEVEDKNPASSQNVNKQKYSLVFEDNSFKISTSSVEGDKVVFTSDSLMYFYLPWFPKNDWSGKLATQGTVLNEKIYIHLWVQSSKQVPSNEFFREDYFNWHLGEYDPKTGNFRLLMDSSYLSLDDTYENDRILFLSPQAAYTNKAGNIIFSITFCEACGPGPWHYGVLNYSTKEFTLIGKATQIEWINDTTIRYKTDSELGVSKLSSQTKEYLDNYYNNCADHPITCHQQIDWSRIPWQEVTI